MFTAPVHSHGRNPTLYLEQDLQLVEHVERLGFDEAWIGEHHSGGTEIIGSPEVFIAAAAQRTRRIRLGTGVVSLPYHHPYHVADRLVLLDHLSRGRVMLGVGPGALPSDAYMMGIDPTQTRPRMEEALEAVVALLTSEEPVSRKTEWFEMVEARLNLRPHQWPHPEIAIATTVSPNGARNAGRFGAGLLSLTASSPSGLATLDEQWQIWSDEAEAHGQVADRDRWRVVAPVHLAPTRDQAIAEIQYGIEAWIDYFTSVVRLPDAPDTKDSGVYTDWLIESGTAAIGTPADCVELIGRMHEHTGGFGCFLAMAHDWASPEATRHSYELMAAEVFPAFQGSADWPKRSHDWAHARSGDFIEQQMIAGRQARERHEREVEARRKRRTDEESDR